MLCSITYIITLRSVAQTSQVTRILNTPHLLTHLREVEVHETEREELEADGEAVEQPEGEGPQSVGCDKVLEVEGEEHRAQGRPQQAQEQERRLVAEALVSVPQHQPELDVDEDEEDGVEDGVDHRQAQSDVGRHGRAQGRQRRELVHRRRLLLRHRGLHDLLFLAGGSGGTSAGARSHTRQRRRWEGRKWGCHRGLSRSGGEEKRREENKANFLLQSRGQPEREAHDQ